MNLLRETECARKANGRKNPAEIRIGSEKRVLRRVLGEKGVVLTPEAQARLDALPERFMNFIATLETVADLGQRESPEPENGRTVRSRPLGGPDHQPEAEGPSTAVVGAQTSEAA